MVVASRPFRYSKKVVKKLIAVDKVCARFQQQQQRADLQHFWTFRHLRDKLDENTPILAQYESLD